MLALPVTHNISIGIFGPLDVLRWLLVLFGVLDSPSLRSTGQRAYLDWHRLLWWWR